MNKDLQQFKKHFGYKIHRENDTEITYRVRGDLDYAKGVASAVIDQHSLPLRLVSIGNMAQLKEFVVRAK